ncbi:hypothetical protein P7C70_g5444, partial [Phenoliferia sp. Uapishka_3]
MAIDSTNHSAKSPEATAALGLPTPSSLPHRHLASSLASSSPSPCPASDDDRMGRSGSESLAEIDGDEELEPFALDDVDMSSPPPSGADDSAEAVSHISVSVDSSLAGSSTAAALRSTSTPSAETARQPFSSESIIRRPFRSRYAIAEGDLSDSSVSLDNTFWDPPPTPSYKRTFEQVTTSPGIPSSEAPEPAFGSSFPSTSSSSTVFSPLTSATSTAPRPGSQYRHSFDSQRASSSLRSRYIREHDSSSSTLRHRSPNTSRSGSRDRRQDSAAVVSRDYEYDLFGRSSEIDRSKRRRPSGSPDLFGLDTPLAFNRDAHEEPAFGNQRALRTNDFASRGYTIDPSLQGAHAPPPTRTASAITTSSQGSLPTRRSRLSLPSILLPSSVLRSSSGPSIRIGGRQEESSGFHSSRVPHSPPLDAPEGTRPRRGSTSFASLATFRRATSTSYRTSPPVNIGSGSSSSSRNAPSGTSSAIEPSTLGTTLLRPRSARARPDVERERQFDPLVAFWREELEHERSADAVERRGRAVLNEAHERLAAAEQTLRETARVLPLNQATPMPTPTQEDLTQDVLSTVEGRLEAADNSIARTTMMLRRFPSVPLDQPDNTEEDFPELPSTQHLPHPARSNNTLTPVSIRVGEGWTPRRSASVTAEPADRQHDFEERSPSISSSPRSEEYPLGTSASRALHFLSNLRSRRPRLSRNSTGVIAPEESSASTSAPQSSIGTPQRRLTPPIGWSEEDELREADSFNRRLLAVRAAGNWDNEVSAEDARGERDLWGQVPTVPSMTTTTNATSSLLHRRLRGPTERANELWRLGREPDASATTTTTSARNASHAPPLPRLVPRNESADTRHSAEYNRRLDAYSPWHSGPLATRNSTRESLRFGEGWSRLDTFAEISTGAAARIDSDQTISPRSVVPASEGEVSVPNPAQLETQLESGVESRPRLFNFETGTLEPDSSVTASLAHFNPFPSPAPSIRRPVNSTLPHVRSLSEHSSIRIAPLNSGGNTSLRSAISRRASQETSRLFAEDDEDGRAPPRIWDPPSRLPPMLPSGSAGRRFVFPHPAAAAGSTVSSYGANPSNETQNRNERATRFHPAFGFEFQTPRPRNASPPTPPSFNRLARNRSPPAQAPSISRSTTLADALAHFDVPLRRRHTGDALQPRESIVGHTPDTTDRASQRQVRTERLASLRRERFLMQSLLGGRSPPRDGDDGIGMDGEGTPRSPGSRLRNLGDFLRGFGPGAGRFAGLFDDDFGFFTRDSAALDPRNYLDDDDFDTSYESLIRLQERIGNVKPAAGVSPDKLSALKTFKYADWPILPSSTAIASPPLLVGVVASTSDVTIPKERGLEKEERCPVCLGDYEDTDDLTLTQCAHFFHSECLSAWFKASPGCPVCRHQH